MGFFERIAGVFGAKRTRPADLQRNDQCWCGSGKKYKKCHYEVDRKKGPAKAARKPS